MTYKLGDNYLTSLQSISICNSLEETESFKTVNILPGIHKTKIALVIVPRGEVDVPPHDLCRLSAIIKASGYQSRVFDVNIELYRALENKLNYNFWSPKSAWHWKWGNYKAIHKYLEPSLLKILNDIKLYSPDVIFFTLYQTNEDSTKWAIQEIKKHLPNVKVAVSGITVQNDCFIKENYYDYVIVGDTEQALLDVAAEVENKKVSNKQKFIIQPINQKLDLNNLPVPDYSDITFNNYVKPNGISIEFSRGCAAKCAFCEETHFWKYRQRTSVDLITEIEHFYREKNIRFFSFIDSIINSDLDELRYLAKTIIEKKLRITWTGNVRCDKNMDLEFFQDLADSGCVQLNFSCESGSQKVLNNIGKNILVHEMEQNLRDCAAVGINVFTSWIVAFPTETYQDYADTMTLLARNLSHFKFISPGSGFFHEAESIIGQNPDLFNLSYQKYLKHWITKDFRLGGTHALIRAKCMSIYLEQIIGDKKIGYPTLPDLKKYHYNIEYIENTDKSVNYDNFNYNIISTNINPYADGLVNEIWPLLRLLWRTKGGYAANIIFDPKLDTIDRKNRYGTGEFVAKFKFSITKEGHWNADFNWDFKQIWEEESFKDPSRQGPFSAQDFSKITTNAAKNARKNANPIWGMDGRAAADYNKLFNEELKLNSEVDWSFNYHWQGSGKWD